MLKSLDSDTQYVRKKIIALDLNLSELGELPLIFEKINLTSSRKFSDFESWYKDNLLDMSSEQYDKYLFMKLLEDKLVSNDKKTRLKI